MTRPISSVTAALLDRRTRELKRHLPAAIKGDGIGVHQARVASRRLREAVPVLGEDLKKGRTRKAQRKIRRVTRALGVVRELDVTLTVLDTLAATGILPRLALEEVRRRVVEEREARRADMLKRLERVNLAKLEKRLQSVSGQLQEVSTDEWRDALRDRLVKRRKALRAAITAAGQMYHPEALHQVRIATKKLRYALEIAAEAGVKAAAPLVAKLKRMQDALGTLHDLQILQGHVASVQARKPGRTLPAGSLDTVADALERQCRHLHARYLAGVEGLLQVADASRSEVATMLAARPAAPPAGRPRRQVRRPRATTAATAAAKSDQEKRS